MPHDLFLKVFFTKYKSVVVRNGSPLKSNFDKVLMEIFEAGILDKVTQASKMLKTGDVSKLRSIIPNFL